MATLATTHTMPGQRGLPLLGGKLNLIRLFRDPFDLLRSMHATYGDVVALAHNDRSFVFGFGPELNHHILAKPDVFENGKGGLVRIRKGSAMERMFTNNIAVMNGAQHKQQRKLMQPAFHRQRIAGYTADMATLTQAMLDRWQPGQQRDLVLDMKQLTQRIAVKTLFGVDDQGELDRVGALLRRTINVTTSPLFAILPFNVPGLPYHRIEVLAAQLEAYIRGVITHKRTQPEGSDVLASLIHVRDEDGSRLSDEELIGHAFTLFVAGHETTSNALAATLLLLEQHPAILSDLLDELDGVLGGAAATLEHTGKLPLLEGVIKESLRLLPPAIIGIRIAAHDTQLGGYAIPKGANVVYSEFVTQRMPDIYAEPDRFKPERWLAIDPSTYEYLPFSAGPHMCIGWAFAMQELRVVLAMILQRFRLSLVAGTPVDLTVRMQPKRGLPMRIHTQDRQFHASPLQGNIRALVDLNT
jgi:cytochrome P450